MPTENVARLPSRMQCSGAALVIGILAIAACGPGTAPSPSSDGPAVAPSTTGLMESGGSVHGWVMRMPGLDPRSGSGAGDAQVPVSGDPITARTGAGRTAATAVSARDGSFSMSLPQGVYTIVEGICGVTGRVDVRSHSATSVTLTIPNSC